MKKTIMILISLISMFSFSQEKINGFGKLKLGMSVSDLPELAVAIQIRNKNEYYKNVYGNTTNKVFEMFPDTNDEYNIVGSLDKRVRSFHIGNMSITDNIFIFDIDLKFFDGKLYEIYVHEGNVPGYKNARKLDELLTTKYGAPKSDSKEEEKYYTNSYGTKITKKDQTFEHTFNTNSPNVRCYYYFSSRHDSKGEISFMEFIRLYETNIWNLVYDAEDEQQEIIKKRIEKREEDKKKELLIGF